MSGAGSFGGQGKGGEPAPGFISPFDMNAAMQGMGQSMTSMANRYAQLGLSGRGATPGSPGGAAGGIGVGNIGRNINFPNIPGNMSASALTMPSAAGQGGGSGFAGLGGSPIQSFNPGGPAGGGGLNLGGNSGGVAANVNDMPTAERMDLGYAPSLTGGIPNEFAALLGELQTQDLAQTSGMSGGGGGGGGKGGGGKGGGMGSMLPMMMMGGK